MKSGLMERGMKCGLAMLTVFGLASLALADVKVGNVTVKPRWPWNGLVDITYHVACDELDKDGQPCNIHVELSGYDAVLKQDILMTSMTGEGITTTVKSGDTVIFVCVKRLWLFWGYK